MKKRTQRRKDLRPQLDAIQSSGVDFENRSIWIVGEINESAYKYVQALQLMGTTQGPITVFIMSHGGDEGVGYAIYDAIRRLEQVKNCPVTTIAMGPCYSIAFLIFVAGYLRLISSSAELMIHDGSIQLPETNMDTRHIDQLFAEMTRKNEKFYKTVVERVPVLKQHIEEFCKAETYFTAEDALTFQIADGIYD